MASATELSDLNFDDGKETEEHTHTSGIISPQPSHSPSESNPLTREEFIKELERRTHGIIEKKNSRKRITEVGVNVCSHETSMEEFWNGFVVQKPNRRRIFFFDGKIEHIHSIDMKAETFKGTFHFYLTRLATMDEIQEYLEDKEKWKKQKKDSVSIRILNAKDDPDSIKLVKKTFHIATDYEWTKGIEDILKFDPRQGVWLRSRWKYSGAFLEEFELYSFPFDCQDLRMMIEVRDVNFSKANVVPLPRDGPYLQYTPMYSTLSDFLFSSVCCEFRQSNRGGTRNNQLYPQVIISVKLKRGWLSQSGLLLSIVVLAACALAVFAIPEWDTGNRLNFLMTLILTDVATQQSVRSTLDDFTYMTALDQFIVSGILFQAVCLAWCSIPYYPTYIASDVFPNMVLTNEIATWSFAIAFLIWLTSWIVRFALLQSMESLKLHQSPAAVEQQYASIHSHVVYNVMPPNDLDMKEFVFEENGHERNLVGFGKSQKIRPQFDEEGGEGMLLPVIHHNEIITNNGKQSMKFHLFFQVGISVVWIVFTLCLAAAWEFVPTKKHIVLMWSQTGTIYFCCLVAAVVSWFVRRRAQVDEDSHRPLSVLEPCGRYYHDFGMIVGQIAIGVSSFCVVEQQDGRLTLMLVATMTMFLIYLIADWITLNTEEPIHRFALTRYAHKCSLIPVFILQGFHGLLLSLPLFVVQSESMSGYRSVVPAVGAWDVAGLILMGCACVIMVLSAVVEDPHRVWSSTRETQSESEDNSNTPEQDVRISSATQLDIAGQSLLPNVASALIVERAPVSSDGDDDPAHETWSRKDFSPYRYIQFPVFLSEIIFSVGLWLMSLPLYARNHPFPLLSVISPIGIVMFHSIISVPLLQSIGQSKFGMKGAYLRWRSTTYSLCCTIRCAFCWREDWFNN